jgi:hypothetical protein
MPERQQLTAEHLALWREGCELLAQMTSNRGVKNPGCSSHGVENRGCSEWDEREGEHYDRFCEIDKRLTWGLVGPWSASLFDAELDGPCNQRPELCQSVDWPTAQAWRRALIEASGETPKPFQAA